MSCKKTIFFKLCLFVVATSICVPLYASGVEESISDAPAYDDNLFRNARVPYQAEVAGVKTNEEGEIFFNAQDPFGKAELEEGGSAATVGYIAGIDFNNFSGRSSAPPAEEKPDAAYSPGDHFYVKQSFIFVNGYSAFESGTGYNWFNVYPSSFSTKFGSEILLVYTEDFFVGTEVTSPMSIGYSWKINDTIRLIPYLTLSTGFLYNSYGSGFTMFMDFGPEVGMVFDDYYTVNVAVDVVRIDLFGASAYEYVTLGITGGFTF